MPSLAAISTHYPDAPLLGWPRVCCSNGRIRPIWVYGGIPVKRYLLIAILLSSIAALASHQRATAAEKNPQELRAEAVRLAWQEWHRWNPDQAKQLHETDEAVAEPLQDYWLTGVGRKVTPAELRDKEHQDQWPWSAAFISWVMKQAGAGEHFHYHDTHSNYVKAAKDNRLSGKQRLFKAYRVTELQPQLGDLVCRSRAGSGATYDNITPGMKTHSDIVVEVHPDHILTIGGNLSDSVGQTKVKLNKSGHIAEPAYYAIIRIGYEENE